MGTISEALIRLVLREKLLKTFERKMVTGRETSVDVLLRRGTNYVVRTRASKGRGLFFLSLTDADGVEVPLYRGKWGRRISVIPGENGLYRIGVVARSTRRDPELVNVTISLWSVAPDPLYAPYQIVASSCGFTRLDMPGPDPAPPLPAAPQGSVTRTAGSPACPSHPGRRTGSMENPGITESQS